MTVSKEVAEVLKALDRAIANVPRDWAFLERDDEVMEQVFEMEYRVKPLGEHFGVDKGVFPEVEALEEDEVKLIVEKIVEVWRAYNYVPDWPEKISMRKAYTTLLGVWDEEVGCYPVGNYHFCFYEMEEFDQDMDPESNHLPF